MAKTQGKAIETNMEGLQMMSRMLDAIQTMRKKIRTLQNENGLTWNDWDYSYTVDHLLAEAGIEYEGDTTETLTATIISVGPYGVTAKRYWGEASAAGTMNVLIHEADSPGITRHAVGDTIRLRAAPTHHSERFVKLQEDE